jgi:hypothetical protein
MRPIKPTNADALGVFPAEIALTCERVGSDCSITFSLLRPQRHHCGHTCVRDELPHVLIVMNEDAEIHGVNRCVSVGDVDFAS